MGKLAVKAVLMVLGLLGSTFATVTVAVISPTSGSRVASPATIEASASSAAGIEKWRVLVGSTVEYTAGAVDSISAPVPIALGTNAVTIEAYDTTGAYGTAVVSLTNSSTPGVTINVVSPTNGAGVNSPTTVTASASSGGTITAWKVYVDNVLEYTTTGTAAISPSLSMAAGKHQITVRAWNEYLVYGTTYVNVTVSGAPVPPAGALLFSDVEASSNWGSCSSSTCSGGEPATDYYVSPYQSSPAENGASTMFSTDGPAYADALYWLHLTPSDTVSNFIWQFDVYADSASTTAAEALEFDFFQVAGGMEYMFASQCDYVTGTWDVWNQAAIEWIHSNATCAKFTPNTWHHLEWAYERVGTQTHYLSITVDGVTQAISSTYAYQPATSTTWTEGAIGIQIQQDLSASPGTGFQEWINNANVYEW